MDNKWYIVNVIAKREDKVCRDINALAKENEFIKEAFIPTKQVILNANAKKKVEIRVLFPNYVFVNMKMNDGAHSVIRSIPNVIGFLGSKLKPEEISEAQIEKLKNKIDEENNLSERCVFEVGDTIKVIEGPFESFTGMVESNDSDKNILKISVSIFGRPTVIEIEANRVEKI